MSEEVLYDEHGQVYERNWSGNYEQKWDFWSQQPARESSQRERTPKDYLEDGTPLYRGSTTSGLNSTSGADGFIELIVTVLVLGFIALAIPLIKLVFEKIILPLFKYILEYVKQLIQSWKAESREFRQLSLVVFLGILSVLLIIPGNIHNPFLVISAILGFINISLVILTMLKVKKTQR